MEHQTNDAEVTLERISEITMDLLARDLDSRNQFIICHNGETFLASETEKGLQALREIKLPVVGDVSAGKSSLINALCKFPISPVAETTTSACPLEIRYSSPTDERLEIVSMNGSDNGTSSAVIYTYGKNMRMDAQLFHELYDYAVKLGKNAVIQVDDTLAYFEAPDFAFLGTEWHPQADTIEGTIFNSNNRRHVMHLLLILLGTYVFQDKSRANLKPEQLDVLKDRDRLMAKLHIPNDIAYSIQLYWHSELIPKDTAIIDLPGLGAVAETGNGQLKHDEQVAEYAKKEETPSLIFLLKDSGKFESSAAKLQLDSFIAANRTKQSATRVSLVLNKADKICEKKKTASSKEESIRTVVNNYTTGYHGCNYEDYPFYAISARSGEKYFMESKIPIDNMFATRLFDWESDDEEDSTSEKRRKKAVNRLERAFEQQYACIFKDKTEQMNLQTFLHHFFSDEVGKIRLLHITDEAESLFICINKWANAILNELKQLESAEEFGHEMFSLLSKKILDTANTIFEKLAEAFINAGNDFTKSILLESTEIRGASKISQDIIESSHPDWMDEYLEVCNKVQRQGSVISVFEQCDKQLSNDINKKINAISFEEGKNVVGKIVVPLDALAVFSDKAKRNYNRLIECGDNIAKMDFMQYFNPAFNRLGTVFNQDRTAYKKLVNAVIDTIKQIPGMMQDDLNQKFENIWASAKKMGIQENLKNGFKCLFYELVSYMTKALSSLFDETISKLKKDDRLEAEINTTIKNVRVALVSVLSPYTSSFGDTIYNAVVKGYWIARLNQQEFKEFVSKNYISQFELELNKKIQDVLYGGNSMETSDSHQSRIQSTVSKIQIDYLSQAEQDRLKANLLSSLTSVGELTPEGITQRRQELLNTGMELKQFFNEDSEKPTIYGWLKNFLLAHMETEDWAITALNSVNRMAEEAKDSVNRIGAFISSNSSPRLY